MSQLPIVAIDVGSNAIRFVLADLTSQGEISSVKKLRQKLRLGHDAFTLGRITPATIKKLISTFQKFRKVMNSQKVLHYRAVATSALRDSKNKKQVLTQLLLKTGIRLEVIEAYEEGRLIHGAISESLSLRGKNALLIDIGGGSVEITHFDHGLIKECCTFPAGTVRILELLRRKKLAEDQLPKLLEKQTALFKFIKRLKQGRKLNLIVGTGGNFESILKLRSLILNRSVSNKFTLKELQTISHILKQTSITERSDTLGMQSDRADVILPACILIEKMMLTAGLETVTVPGVGLKEGLLFELRNKLFKF